MPAEKFWDSATAVEGDGSTPVLVVSWHDACPCGETFVALNGVKFDASGIDRLIKTLHRARRKAYGKRLPQHA